MFEAKNTGNTNKQASGQSNLASRQSTYGNAKQTTSQTQLPKTKCAGGVCMVDWRPIPLFYRSN